MIIKKWSSPKEYLSQIKFVDQKITNMQESIDELWAKATRVNRPLKSDLVQEGGKFNNELVDKLIDLRCETNVMIDELVDLKISIEKEIECLDNELFSRVLYQRYILNKKLFDIAESLNYGESYIKKVHGWALVAFRNRFSDKFERRNPKEL